MVFQKLENCLVGFFPNAINLKKIEHSKHHETSRDLLVYHLGGAIVDLKQKKWWVKLSYLNNF